MFGSLKSRYEILDDTSLLQRFRETSNLELLGVLYHRYMHLVYGLSLKYLKDPEDSKDAVMQIFENLSTSVANQDIRNFKAWLYTVSKNHCLRVLKNRQLRTNVEAIFMESDEISTLNGEIDDDYEKIINAALANLSIHQQECLKLFFYENLSYQQISEETGYDLKKVKSYIQNGKRNLKLYLDGHER
ncbi:MAG: DNA-directed RNA polymerase sigma-70 factor [Cyclobacteriaceae bacterium]|nr:MAG: DNA-directed RNA polymerase sigma-70 factor [Cyclobacteriaceae bacterium]